MSSRYGGERIRRGLAHFVLGKGVSAVAGVFATLLVIRELSVESFAAYSVLVALVEMLTALSGLGLAHALLRYVPELYARHYQSSLRRFVYGAFGLRTGVLLLVATVAYVFADKVTLQIGLGGAVMAFQVFLLAVLFRSSTHFLSQVLESTLHQGRVQSAFAVATLMRLAGLLYLVRQGGEISLVDVIWVEVAGDALGFLIMMYGVIRVVSDESVGAAPDDGGWLRRHLKQIAKFALAGYAQHLVITPYGGHTNRLVGGGMLGAGAMAAYGFSQTLYEYMKRYMPAQLLLGLIRPVVVARYCEKRDFSSAAWLCEQVLQINILLTGGVLAMLMVGGSDALAAISAGKYGAEALVVLLGLLLVLLLETQRQQIELLVQTVERYQYLIPSNIALAASVVPAVVLLPLIGAVAFPVANAAGLFVANGWVQRRLKREGFHFRHDWFSTIRTLLLCLVAVCLGGGARYLGAPWYVAAAISAVSYVAMAYVFCLDMVRGFVRVLAASPASRLPAWERASEEVGPVRIAFGILSSKQSARAIDEIAAAVFPHPVYVHHDFSKQPDFSPTASNVKVLQRPVATAWGDWSLVEASFLLMEAAMEDQAVTHFQLLSEACLPVRPIREFEDFLRDERPEVMIDFLPLQSVEAVASHGWRYFQQSSLVMRLLRRASHWVGGGDVRYRMAGSVNLRLAGSGGGVLPRVKRTAGICILRIFARMTEEKVAGSGIRHLAIGGQWFGASRRAVTWLLRARHACVTLTQHYQRAHIPDESYLHTLVLNAQLADGSLRVYPSNHALFWDGCGTGPDMLGVQDVERIRTSGKFFSRKFSLTADDPARCFFL